jgi:hypothetical protein
MIRGRILIQYISRTQAAEVKRERARGTLLSILRRKAGVMKILANKQERPPVWMRTIH